MPTPILVPINTTDSCRISQGFTTSNPGTIPKRTCNLESINEKVQGSESKFDIQSEDPGFKFRTAHGLIPVDTILRMSMDCIHIGGHCVDSSKISMKSVVKVYLLWFVLQSTHFFLNFTQALTGVPNFIQSFYRVFLWGHQRFATPQILIAQTNTIAG